MNYYNEFDPQAAAWLRELIKAKLIPTGFVDERSIVDVNPYELTQYTQHHFFAGIGGWSHALRLAGWPESRPVVTASCPCQPFSAAGKKRGASDERHLWPVFRDILTHLKSSVAFGEQVASKDGREWLAGVRTDLEGLGYEVGAADLCAASVGAPHIRQRIYWMANRASQRRRGRPANPGKSSGRNGVEVGGIIGGLDNANCVRAQRAGRAEQFANAASQAGGLGNTDGAGSFSRIGATEADRHRRSAFSDGGALRMANADSRKRDGVANGEGCELDRTTTGRKQGDCKPESSSWDVFEIVHCTDGKARRFEPGSFPLAHGVSGRVGLLRGYGNAIVPPLAALFIQAATESEK